ncbi:MAG TPA: DUF4870 domain-containing protein [Methylophilus sp.]|nr:DUF4870 domain-containing protein [Methylophilus sp.]HQQ33663.1 DUF4870 domain-containing protein [Methylophilus sp.]
MADIIPTPNNDDKNIATVTHLAGTVFFFIPALVVWILKKDENPYLASQSREALNFQITVLIAMFVAKALIWLLVGLALVPLVWLANILFCIIAGISTSKGKQYRYPFCLRLIN